MSDLNLSGAFRFCCGPSTRGTAIVNLHKYRHGASVQSWRLQQMGVGGTIHIVSATTRFASAKGLSRPGTRHSCSPRIILADQEKGTLMRLSEAGPRLVPHSSLVFTPTLIKGLRIVLTASNTERLAAPTLTSRVYSKTVGKPRSFLGEVALV
jgi:hypothetical protein